MKLDGRRDALLVIDLQPDFMEGGPLAVAGGRALVAPIAAFLPRFRTIVATQDWHPAGHASFASTHGRAAFETMTLHGSPHVLWPDHCIQGTPGAALHPELPTERLSLILRKGAAADVDSYSALRENVGPDQRRHSTGLGACLTSRGITRVFVCGLARDYCVRFSAEDAAAEGFETFVVDDLTRAVRPDLAAETDAALERARVRVLASTELE